MSVEAWDSAAAAAALRGLAARPIAPFVKGFDRFAGQSADHVVQSGVGASELAHPVAVVDVDALQHNIDVMASHCRTAGVELAPHVKTTMSPQIFLRQLAAGAWAATVANPTQAQVVVAFGVRRVILANEVGSVGEAQGLAVLMAEHPDLEVLCFADSPASVALLYAGLRDRALSRPLEVVIEVGVEGGRAGARTVAEVLEAARAVLASRRLALRGVGGFEGILAPDRTPASLDAVRLFLRAMVEAGARLSELPGASADQPLLLTAGGSVFFDLVEEELLDTSRHDFSRTVVVRSGGYVAHDRGYLDVLSPLTGASGFRPALEVRGRVLSVPDPTLAVVGVGKRDIGNDIAPPSVTSVWTDRGRAALEGCRVAALNDQHAYLRSETGGELDKRIVVGAVVAFAPAHPCTTFDRWTHAAIVDTNDRVIDVARTYF